MVPSRHFRRRTPGYRFATVLGTSLFAGLMMAGSVMACSFHPTTFGGFQSAYPGSLATAVAVGSATASGQLPAVELRNDVLGFWQVTRLLERLGAGLKSTSEEAPDFSLLLIEQRLWTEFAPRSLGNAQIYTANVHTPPPGPEATVIVTAFPVLHAMLGGGISPEKALDSELMIVAGKNREAVLKVLSHAEFPAIAGN